LTKLLFSAYYPPLSAPVPEALMPAAADTPALCAYYKSEKSGMARRKQGNAGFMVDGIRLIVPVRPNAGEGRERRHLV